MWQSASVPGQVLADRHSTQWEAPSHTRLPPQAVPDATGRCAGVPAPHSSVVQTLPSTGRSALSLNTCELPAPSHCSPLQSPAVGSTSLVPVAVKLNPQTPAALQVRVRQAVSLPGQSAATAQPTHWPVSLQWFAPPQLEFAGIVVCDAVPELQMSLVQGLRSSGTSVSSLAGVTVPSAATGGACSHPWSAR